MKANVNRSKHSTHRRRTTALVIVGIVAALLLPLSASANAPARVCDPGEKPPYWSFSGKKPIYIRAKNGRVYGDSGVTLTITKGTSKTIGGSITGTVSAEAGVIFAKASASLAIQVQYSHTTTTTFSGSWTVPKNQETGWLEVGTNNGYTFRWQRYHDESPCKKVVDASGKAKGPTTSAALRYRHS